MYIYISNNKPPVLGMVYSHLRWFWGRFSIVLITLISTSHVLESVESTVVPLEPLLPLGASAEELAQQAFRWSLTLISKSLGQNAFRPEVAASPKHSKTHRNHSKIPPSPGHPSMFCHPDLVVPFQKGGDSPRMLVRTILEGSTVVMKVILQGERRWGAVVMGYDHSPCWPQLAFMAYN